MSDKDQTNRPLLPGEKQTTAIVKKEAKSATDIKKEAPKAKPPVERRKAESTKDGNFMPWVIGALALLVILLAVSLFKGGNTKKEEKTTTTEMAELRALVASLKNDTTPPPASASTTLQVTEKAPTAPRPEENFLAGTQADELRALMEGWDSVQIKGYHVPMIRNTRGNPSPILATSSQPYPLAPRGTVWEVVKYKIPTGTTYEVWATKTNPGS